MHHLAAPSSVAWLPPPSKLTSTRICTKRKASHLKKAQLTVWTKGSTIGPVEPVSIDSNGSPTLRTSAGDVQYFSNKKFDLAQDNKDTLYNSDKPQGTVGEGDWQSQLTQAVDKSGGKLLYLV